MLTCKNLTLNYKDGKNVRTVLNNLSLDFETGRKYAVLGPSGCGKSSLLYVLSGLRRPTTGTVSLDGTDIFSMSADRLADIRRERFGFIFQKHFLIPYLTALENVLVGKGEHDAAARQEALSLLADVGLVDVANKKPAELSGGECQRVAVARALANNPSVIFADEPTASLDHKTALEIYSLLCSYDATLIVATHDVSVLSGAETVIRLIDANCPNAH